MLPESKELAPLGTDVEVTVCGAESPLVHLTVSLIVIVMVDGMKVRAWFDPAPPGMLTGTVAGFLIACDAST